MSETKPKEKELTEHDISIKNHQFNSTVKITEQTPTKFQKAFIFVCLMIPALYVLYVDEVFKLSTNGQPTYSSVILISYIIFYIFYFHILGKPLISAIKNNYRYVMGYITCYSITFIIAGMLYPPKKSAVSDFFSVILIVSFIYGLVISIIYSVFVKQIYTLIDEGPKAFFTDIRKSFVAVGITSLILLHILLSIFTPS